MDLRADRAVLVSDWPACELKGEVDMDASELAVGDVVKVVRGSKVPQFPFRKTFKLVLIVMRHNLENTFWKSSSRGVVEKSGYLRSSSTYVTVISNRDPWLFLYDCSFSDVNL